MKRAAFVSVVCALVGACGQDPLVIPGRTLDRPADMAFVCLAVYAKGGSPDGGATDALGATENVLSGQAMATCHPPGLPDPDVDLTNRTRGTFGFVTNSARGELAIVDFQTGRVVDLDPALPGHNFLPVGHLPEVVAATQDGCQVMVADRGSCALTLVDPARLLAGQFTGTPPSTGAGMVTRTLVPTTSTGRPLMTPPGEVLFLPQDSATLASGANLCDPEGMAPGGENTPWRALVSFPACDLVAMLDVPSGRIVSSVYVRAGGVVAAGSDPVCPAVCDGQTMDVDASLPSSPDASVDAATDGGVPPVGVGGVSLGVTALAVHPKGAHVYIGATNADFVAVASIGPTGLAPPMGPKTIPLAEGAGGVTRLRLSLDPFAMVANEGTIGKFVSNRNNPRPNEFLYAVARDGSIRVIDVGRRMNGLAEAECDVNVDPLAITGISLPCYPVGDPATPPRRPLAEGPGLRLPRSRADAPAPLPRDIAFASVFLDSDVAATEQILSGAFGFTLASNGEVYIINLDPNTRAGEPVPLTHSLRNGYSSSLTGRGGPARVLVAPERLIGITDVPFPSRVAFTRLEGPRLEGVTTDDSRINPVAAGSSATTWVFFPDPTIATPQRWAIIWEGSLPEATRRTGAVTASTGISTPAGAMDDVGADFCRSGVLPGDIVLFSGCGRDLDCDPDGSELCHQATPAAPGLCLKKAQADDEALVRRCSRPLSSRRRYEVLRSAAGHLDLGLKIDEVVKTSLRPCDPAKNGTPENDCQPTAAYRSLRDGDPGFECRVVRTGEAPRCVKRCALTRDGAGNPVKDDRACRPGSVCEDVAGALADVGPLCVEGPPIDPACWPKNAIYRVQAGKSFVVSGNSVPTLPVAREVGGSCAEISDRHPLVVNRIPLDAPACADPFPTSLDALSGKTPPTAASGRGNPCLFLGANADDPDGSHVKAVFQNHQVRFIMTNLEQHFGDSLLIHFDAAGGLLPLVVSVPDSEITVSMGVRLLTGPFKTAESVPTGMGTFSSIPYMFLIDQGRSAFVTSASRGQILRINPRNSSANGIPLFDSNFTRNPFRIQ